MHLEAHAGVGWALGVLAPGSDRRLRNWCVFAAVVPDVDAVAYLWGPEAYMNWHHTFGHNVFLGAMVVAAAAWNHRAKWARTAVVVGLAFASHLVSDMKLSAYEVELFWPVSRVGYEFTPNYGLGFWVNTVMVYGSFVFAAVLAGAMGVSPLDVISPRLDRIVLNFFRKRGAKCGSCGRACNNACDACGRATCLRHGRLEGWFRVRCARCDGNVHSPAVIQHDES